MPKKILFFSRGRGRGHAIPDIEIVKSLRDVEVQFVSYGTGARTIAEFGYALIDLGLPEMNSIAETTVLAGKAIGRYDPDLVVSHEEFAALPAAKIFDKPAACLLDWFTDASMFSMQSLRFADSILFLDKPGVFDEPPTAAGKVIYAGPVLRPLEWSMADRERARVELGIPGGALLITVLPGSWTEQKAPMLEEMAGAFDGLEVDSKRLIWIAGEDYELISRHFAGREDVTVIERDWVLERYMAASDLAVTKGSRGILMQLEALGVPTLAVTHGNNPMDDRRVQASAIAELVPVHEMAGRLLRRGGAGATGDCGNQRASVEVIVEELERLMRTAC